MWTCGGTLLDLAFSVEWSENSRHFPNGPEARIESSALGRRRVRAQ